MNHQRIESKGKYLGQDRVAHQGQTLSWSMVNDLCLRNVVIATAAVPKSQASFHVL